MYTFSILILISYCYGQVMVRFLIKAAFGGETLLFKGGAYFDLVKWCSVRLRPGVYKRKCGKVEDAQYS